MYTLIISLYHLNILITSVCLGRDIGYIKHGRTICYALATLCVVVEIYSTNN